MSQACSASKYQIQMPCAGKTSKHVGRHTYQQRQCVQPDDETSQPLLKFILHVFTSTFYIYIRVHIYNI